MGSEADTCRKWIGPKLQTVGWDNEPHSIAGQQDVRWKFGMPPVNNANYAWIQHFINHISPVGVAGFGMAKTTGSAHSCSTKIAEDTRKYATEQGIAEEEALKKGMGEKSRGFTEKGSELYAKA